ncbi:MAG: hypothetical protein ABSB95_05460 [Dissulfurispiraceae bacterium]|jgi:hypothetical protein
MTKEKDKIAKKVRKAGEKATKFPAGMFKLDLHDPKNRAKFLKYVDRVLGYRGPGRLILLS